VSETFFAAKAETKISYIERSLLYGCILHKKISQFSKSRKQGLNKHRAVCQAKKLK